jgi:hypothetical protein
MNKLAALTLSAATLAALIVAIDPAPVGATQITWSFYETAITSCNNPGSCVLPPQPFVFMTLALPGPTSSGTATWLGTVNQPVYTGDSFTLTTGASFMRPLTPAFMAVRAMSAGAPAPMAAISATLTFHGLRPRANSLPSTSTSTWSTTTSEGWRGGVPLA